MSDLNEGKEENNIKQILKGENEHIWKKERKKERKKDLEELEDYEKKRNMKARIKSRMKKRKKIDILLNEW